MLIWGAHVSGPALVYQELSYPVHRLKTGVGRNDFASGVVPAIDLAPLDRDRVVSRRHAEIVLRAGRMVLVDLRARNGLWVNGERVPEGGERPLSDGDAVSFGGVVLTFR